MAFLSHTAMGGNFVVGSHHLARAMHSLGHSVTHVSAPVSLAHLFAAIPKGFIRERLRRWVRGGDAFSGVKDVVPFTPLPWALARTSRVLMKSYSRLMLAAPFRSFDSVGLDHNFDCLIVDEPRFVGAVAATSVCKVVYRATDLYAALRKDSKILDAERLLCARASVLVATSNPVADHLRTLANEPVHVITNGVEFEHFSNPVPRARNSNAIPGQRSDRAVYVGAFDRRFSRNAFRLAAVNLPNKTFLLVGPGSIALANELSLRNVIALGAVAYSELPGILQRCAVGLLPMSADAANEGRSPMKLYEYAAAGLCVAATTTQELSRRVLPTLCVSSGEAEFHNAVVEAFERSKQADLVNESLRLAQLETWQEKARKLIQLIESGSMEQSRAPGSAPALLAANPVAGELQ